MVIYIKFLLMKLLTYLGLCLYMTRLISVAFGTQFSYPCDVDNCLQCSSYNFCGVCQPNYLIQIDPSTGFTICSPVQCSIPNCSYCMEDQKCEKCQDQWMMDSDGLCVSKSDGSQIDCLVSNCLACSILSPIQCAICQYGFILFDGKCQPQLLDGPDKICKVGFTPSMCRICQNSPSYMISPSYQCVPTPSFTCFVDNCLRCSAENKCGECLEGFSLNGDGSCSPILCNQPHCQKCSNSDQCSQCQLPYYIQEDGTCSLLAFGCSVENCLYCSSTNHCQVCQTGFYATEQYSFVLKKSVSVCSSDFSIFPYYNFFSQNCQEMGILKSHGILNTDLVAGCVFCSQSFVNVGGFCTMSFTYFNGGLCNVQNCEWCNGVNYCGKCQPGYTVWKKSAGQCMKDYSSIPNCQLSNPDDHNQCLICKEGYIVSPNPIDSIYLTTCIPSTSPTVQIPFECSIVGCKVCLSENVCSSCVTGMQLSQSQCQPSCSIENCQICSSESSCDQCLSGFMYNQTLGACQSIVCSDLFGEKCVSCSQYRCEQCAQGFQADASPFCSPVAAHNMIGCTQYQNENSETCTQCKYAYVLKEDQCLGFVCDLQNCAYCEDNVCKICEQGYFLEKLAGKFTCSKFPVQLQCPDNCVNCIEQNTTSSTTQIVCIQCLQGYVPFDGQCFCQVQNCLSCQLTFKSTYCTLCASPFVASPFGECVPPPSTDIICQSANCQTCLNVNQCSMCMIGYELSEELSCVRRQCNISDCILCVDNYACGRCEEGFILVDDNCSKIPQNYTCLIPGCVLCDLNSSDVCVICDDGFYLQNRGSECVQFQSHIQNCLFSYSESKCLVCSQGYYLTSDQTCQIYPSNSVCSHCLYCSYIQSQLTLYPTCMACEPGYTLQTSSTTSQAYCTSNKQIFPCELRDSHCQLCMGSICLICQQNYFVSVLSDCRPYTSNSQCSIDNCRSCQQNSCEICSFQWEISTSPALLAVYSFYNQQQYHRICISQTQCQDQNCLICSSSTQCLKCKNGLVLTQQGCEQTHCGVQNCLLCGDLGICLLCEDGFIVNERGDMCGCPSNSTAIECMDSECQLQFCKICSPFGSECLECQPNFSLVYIEITNQSSCECFNQLINPNSETPQCIKCSVSWCQTCSQSNVCAPQGCMHTFINVNGACQCPQHLYLNQKNQCQCKDGQKTLQVIDDFGNVEIVCVCDEDIENSTCICNDESFSECLQCGVSFCSSCANSSEFGCSECLQTFEPIINDQNLTVCVCPPNKTLSPEDSRCYTCQIDNCIQCQGDNTCVQCRANLVLISSQQCGCSSNLQFNPVSKTCQCSSSTYYSVQSNQCEPCPSNCEECINSKMCTKCSPTFSLFSVDESFLCSCGEDQIIQQGKCSCPSGSSRVNGLCLSCENVEYCLYCSGSEGICMQCQPGFTLQNNSCICGGNLSVMEKQDQFNMTYFECGCGEGQKIFQDTCISCNFSNCAQCSEADQCSKCQGSLLLINNQSSCGCLDTYIQDGTNCICPPNTVEVVKSETSSCAPCPQNCQKCVSPTLCISCFPTFWITFIKIQNSSQLMVGCSCEPTFSLSSGPSPSCTCPSSQNNSSSSSSCLSCQIPNCAHCPTQNVCSKCMPTFNLMYSPTQTATWSCVCPDSSYILSDSRCICPSNAVEYQHQCISCSVERCLVCNRTNSCFKCSETFMPISGANGNLICGCSAQMIFNQQLNMCVCPQGTYQNPGTFECVDCNLFQCNGCMALSGQTIKQGFDCNTCSFPPDFDQIDLEYLLQCISCLIFGDSSSSEPVLTCYSCEFPYSLEVDPETNAFICGCQLPFVLNFTSEGESCLCPPGSVANNKTCEVQYCTEYDSQHLCIKCEDGLILHPQTRTCSCALTYELVISPDGVPSCKCPRGFSQSDDNACYLCLIPNCVQCGATNNCAQCASPFQLQQTEFGNSICSCPQNSTFTFNQTTNTCVECSIPSCSQCQLPNICSQCQPTYIIDQNSGSCVCPINYQEHTVDIKGIPVSKCIQCNVLNCQNCNLLDNICTKCVDGYDLMNGINYCMQCNIQNCNKCISDNVCQLCQAGFSLSSTADSCLTCNVNGCEQCSQQGKCAICENSLSLSYQNISNNLVIQGQCIKCVGIRGCLACSQTNVCSVCMEGYSLNPTTNKCQFCSFPCQTCEASSNSQCASCMKPYSQEPASNGTCYTCNIANCLQCSSSSLTTCSQCVSGYSFNANSQKCTRKCSISKCSSCSSTTPVTCQSCLNGYVASPSGQQCLRCQNTPQCQQCSSTNTSQCIKCSVGYYLNLNDASSGVGICEACPANCQTCAYSLLLKTLECVTYKSSTRQFRFQMKNSANVIINLPARCDPGCTRCNPINPKQCRQCVGGFVLDQNTGYCEPCPFLCRKCTITTNQTDSLQFETECLECYSNAYLVDGSCSQCSQISNCLTCSSESPSVCTSCPIGYSLDLQTSECVKGCPSNCVSCSTPSICDLCVSGFTTSNGDCVPCTSNCRQCSNEAPGICISCGSGLFLNQDTSLCQSCSVLGCMECEQQGICSVCQEGYTLSPSFTCARNCERPCATCSQNSSTICLSCLAGYVYDESTSTCKEVSECPDGCSICPLGYVLTIEQNCLKCNKQSCARCAEEQPSICLVCNDGTYLSVEDNECQACPQGCETCSSSVNCLSCESGYGLIRQMIEDSPQQCVLCQQPCAQCIGNSQTCVSCISGFSLVGWKCVSNFNFQIKLTLSAQLSVFYSKYKVFLQNLINIISPNANINLVSVNQILQGSTILNAQLITTAAPDSTQAQQQYSALQNKLSEGSTIDGMTIQSSQVSVNGGSLGMDESSKNYLGLILGLAIPVGIIVIGGIMVVVLKKKKKEKSEKMEMQMNTTGRGIREELDEKIQGGNV